VLVADRSAESRDAIACVLERTGCFEVVSHASDGFDAVDAAKALQPDLTVLAVTLPRLSGFEALRYVRAAVPDGIVIVASALTERCVLDVSDRSSSVDACHVDLPVSTASAAIARAFVDGQLVARGRRALGEIANLLVSEVVTNAVVHGRSASRLSIESRGDALCVQVTDWGGGAVVMRPLLPLAMGGRGLHIVDALADVWGTISTPRSKTVWFEMGGVNRASRDNEPVEEPS
jgi:CheY-like chemotaxis protein